MLKLLIFSLMANMLLFGSSLFLIGSMSVILFLGLIYLMPICFNLIIYREKKTRNIVLSVLLSLATTIGYCIFSYLFMEQPAFIEFVRSNTRDFGELSVSIQSNLLTFGQIFFVFILNFGAMYLFSKMVGGKKDVESQIAY